MITEHCTSLSLAFAAAAALTAAGAGADLVWSNGQANPDVTFSHGDGAMLDDVTLPDGGAWLNEYRTSGYFLLHGEETGACLLSIRANADGDMPGDVMLELDITSHSDVMNGEIVDGRPLHLIAAQFEPVFLPAGRYWIDVRVESRDGNGLVQLGSEQTTGQPCWHRNAQGEMQVSIENADTSFDLFGDAENIAVFPPSSFEIIRGRHLSGTPLELRESDDHHVVIDSMYAFSAPLIQIEITGSSIGSTANIRDLAMVIESETLGTLIDGLLKVEAFDFEQGRWETAGFLPAPVDEETIIVMQDDAQRFFNPETGEVKARLNWLTTTLSGQPAWGVKIDRTSWHGWREPV